MSDQPERKPHETEPHFEPMVRLLFKCSCGAMGTIDDRDAVVVSHGGGTVNTVCNTCKRPIVIRKGLIRAASLVMR